MIVGGRSRRSANGIGGRSTTERSGSGEFTGMAERVLHDDSIVVIVSMAQTKPSERVVTTGCRVDSIGTGQQQR